MKLTSLYLGCMVVSSLIILLGAFEIIGIWAASDDPLVFGIGVIITGGILLAVSGYGYIEAVSDEVQEILDNIQDEIYMAAHEGEK